MWFHIKNFGDSSLHYKKVWIMYIKRNRMKQISDTLVVRTETIDPILRTTVYVNLLFE